MRLARTFGISLGLLGFAATLVACAGLSPSKRLYALEAGYTGALAVAVEYKGLVPCGRGVLVCSDPQVVTRLQMLDHVAKPSLDAAQEAASAPGSGQGPDLEKLISAAESAVRAFEAASAPLKTQ